MTPLTRRAFLKSSSLASATLAFPSVLRSAVPNAAASPYNRLNIACVGVGGRGYHVVSGLKHENLVAFCDVDDERAGDTYREFPAVPRFRDYRKMFDQLGAQIDAVAIATPDHMHFPIAMTALALGKHVFVEKPLTHTIDEAQKLAARAREKNLATQMGNQGHASDATRLLKEWIDAGVLGDVRELHSWTTRPLWPQGVRLPDHSKSIPVIPSTLDWDLWLGVAEPRAYDPAYLPFNWRGYWDFGTGAIGDMGCHLMDGAWWALDLGAPASIEAVSAKHSPFGPPGAAMITFEFPARAPQPAVKWTWYEGGLQPTLPPWFEIGRRLPDNGTFIVGSRSAAFAEMTYQSLRLVPESKMRELAPTLPPRTIPRVPNGDHFAEWTRACKGGPPAGSNFDYASRLTETVLLANLALRTRRRIEWDAAARQVTNLPTANEYLAKSYRAGFGV